MSQQATTPRQPAKVLTPIQPVNAPPPLFTVDTPPYMHLGFTIRGMMRDTVIALLPAAMFAIIAFGIAPLRVMALAMATTVLVDALCLRLSKRDLRLYDGTALVTGLIFSFLLPAGAPWWLVIIGAATCSILGRQVFGGLGANPLCPALVGWAVLTISWPTYMDPGAMTLNTDLVDPLLRLKFFGPHSLPDGGELSLFLGQQLGGLGSAQVAAVLAGGLYMVARRVVRWEIIASFLCGVGLTGTIFWLIDPAAHIRPDLYFLTGSTMFAAFFLATDPASSPVGIIGMILFGLLAGTLLVLIRVYGAYPDGAPFAVLVANLTTPLLDLIRPLPYGVSKRRS